MADDKDDRSGWPPRIQAGPAAKKADEGAAANTPPADLPAPPAQEDLAVLDDETYIPWNDAVEHLKEYLPRSPFNEQVVSVGEEVPGMAEEQSQIQVTSPSTADASTKTVYMFSGVRLKVRNLATGKERDAVYAVRFHWQGGRWRIVQPPGVMF
jgi:hypothetical protein